ncbi:hypothetical protein BK816_05640 [Boudabousia tangfeifanii]|uniref:Cell division protein SepF n=1 Tax=Boudabousia tangfeifanii TaxID=1912795 RepID=A0A1D9MKG3_9ACTO|nr:cell division protein SepF [Boudabousia tangfeifanii]AOZ72841.1 hypothetical protein BK816_05640 [Boudabousia tangfeifanii]
MANMFMRAIGKMNLAEPEFEDQELEYEDGDQYAEYEEGGELVQLHSEDMVDYSRIMTVRPRTYGDSDTLAIADSLIAGVPVIVNISDLPVSDQSSTLDFISGVVYALKAHFERVTGKVYLLSPQVVSIVDGEGQPLAREPW